MEKARQIQFGISALIDAGLVYLSMSLINQPDAQFSYLKNKNNKTCLRELLQELCKDIADLFSIVIAS